METLWQDLKYAARMLRKNPGFAFIAVLTLALGIGANTAIFSVVNSVLLRPLPYPEPDRLVILGETAHQSDSSVSYSNFEDWRAQNHVFETMAALRRDSFNLTQYGEPERLSGRLVSAGWLEALRVHPFLGRTISAEEDKLGANPVVVLSYQLWQRRFSSDPAMIGKSLWLNGRSHTIIAVLPQDFQHYSFTSVDLFVPIGSEMVNFRERGNHPGIYVLGRLKPGVTLAQARAEMSTIAAGLEKKYPDTNHEHGVRITPLRESVVGDVQPALLILLAAVGLVLLIACANVSNLLLARATARQREITIRQALGAGVGRLIQQLLTESILLALVGGAVGLLFASWTIGAVRAYPPANIPRVEDIRLGRGVLEFNFILSVLTGIFFGLVPALKASAVDLARALKGSSGQSTGTRTHQRLRSVFIVAEFSLTLILLLGTGLLLQSFAKLRGIDPGYDPRRLLSVEVSPPESSYQGRKMLDFYEELRRRAAALPAVESAGYTNDMPFVFDDEEAFHVEGQPLPKKGEFPLVLENITSGSYFQTMKIRILQGRVYTEADSASSGPIVVVDEDLARKFFNGDAIGKHLRIGEGNDLPPFEIVGVVAHVAHFNLDGPEVTPYQMYLPYHMIPEKYLYQAGRTMAFVIRTKGDPLSVAPALRTQVLALDPNLPIYSAQTMETLLADSIAPDRFSAILLGSFAALALLLAAAGLYGVISYSVSQRTQEIGIRMALGARSESVLKLVVGEGLRLVAAGIVVGLVGSLALTRLISSQLHGVRATDPVTFVGVAALLAAVALGACYVPARRAMRVDPMVALRYE